MRYSGFIAAGAGLVVIGIGLWTAGSPLKARYQKFDQARVAHLQAISSDLTQYWGAKNNLPQKLDELNDALRNINVPVDPETNAAYEYSRESDTNFKLCATFREAAKEEDSISKYSYYLTIPSIIGSTWAHPAGHFCFARTIDKDFFKTPKPTD